MTGLNGGARLLGSLGTVTLQLNADGTVGIESAFSPEITNLILDRVKLHIIQTTTINVTQPPPAT